MIKKKLIKIVLSPNGAPIAFTNDATVTLPLATDRKDQVGHIKQLKNRFLEQINQIFQ